MNLVTQRARPKDRPRGSQRQRPALPALPAPVDTNLAAAGLLYDMAALQPTERSQFGYKRAAKAIAALDVTVEELIAAGTLREVPFVGPSSERIVSELVRLGTSPTLDSAIEKSGKRAAVEARRAFRTGYLSHLALRAALSREAPAGTVGRADYRGDFQMHSTWSEGGERIVTTAQACQDLGHTCMGITDHSYGLPIAGGMSMEAVGRQHREIDRLNEKLDGLRAQRLGLRA